MKSGLIGGSREHLEKVGENYLEHQSFAFRVGWSMVVAGCACILHSLIPALFTDTASRTIDRLHHGIRYRSALAAMARPERSPLWPLATLCSSSAALPWLSGAQPIVALPLSALSLALLIAYGWSEEDQGNPIELLLPVRLD